MFPIFLLIFVACEEVVVIALPAAQNLITVESWLTSIEEIQRVNLSRSNGFSDSLKVQPITSASVRIRSLADDHFLFLHRANGMYESIEPFSGQIGVEYKLIISLPDGKEILSHWQIMEEQVPINALTVSSFRENNPQNPTQQFTVFFPKISARDPETTANTYRWIFYKNRTVYAKPESITVQNDRLFNGNLIPNDFMSFSYDEGEEIIVELQSISQKSYNYLTLLKSQITSLGTAGGTTPTSIDGNLFYSSPSINEAVLGYFGTATISRDTVMVE